MASQGINQLAQTPITVLKGVGPSMAQKLEKIALFSLQDLLFHLPLRYEDRTRISCVRDVLPGTYTNIIGEVTANQIVNGRRRMLLVTLNDGTGSINLRFFHFSASQKRVNRVCYPSE